MKHVVWLSLVLLVSSDAIAQHGGISGHGGRGTGGFAPRHSPTGRFPRERFIRGTDQRFGTGFYGLFDDDYDFGYPDDFAYPIPPPLNIVQPRPPVIVQQAPPPIARAVIHEYPAGSSSAPGGGQATFVIAFSDGRQVQATAVWVQDGVVHYFDTDDLAHQMPLISIDRSLTRKLNSEKNLILRLPLPR